MTPSKLLLNKHKYNFLDLLGKKEISGVNTIRRTPNRKCLKSHLRHGTGQSYVLSQTLFLKDLIKEKVCVGV